MPDPLNLSPDHLRSLCQFLTTSKNLRKGNKEAVKREEYFNPFAINKEKHTENIIYVEAGIC
jgi:hypothetical protein